MKITATQYARSLYELTAGKSEREIDGVVEGFVKLLQKNRQLKLAGKIVEIFNNIWNKEKGIVEAEVISKEKLGGELRNQVSNYVSKRYNAKEVVLNNRVDLDIKGGIVIKVGDEILDGSVARQLEELRSSLEK